MKYNTGLALIQLIAVFMAHSNLKVSVFFTVASSAVFSSSFLFNEAD